MSVIDEIIEDMEKDKEIVKSFVPKDTLPKNIFDINNGKSVLNSEVRKKILKITEEFIDFVGVNFFIYDIIFIGSLANYNWSEYSDVDIHILIDYDEFDESENKDLVVYHQIVQELFDVKRRLWNETTDIKIKGYEVEMYVQDVDDKYGATGVYSILNNEWIVEPKKIESAFDIDEKKILEKSEEYAKEVERLEDLNNKGQDVSKEIKTLKDKLKKFRQSGLEKGGEYSYENLTFKLLRRNGFIEKLFNIKSSIRNKKLSLPQ